VGAGAARHLQAAGIRIIAVSDQYGAVRADDGLDINALCEHVERAGSVVEFSGGEAFFPDDLLELAVDVLAPCAVESVIHADNADRVRASIVVEGANGPTTPAADTMLNKRGVMVVPDILANAGGVIVSYFELVQANQAYWWSAAEVETRLRERLLATWQEVRVRAERDKLTLREAATDIAVTRVADAHLLRGLYP
jgi:glutamate dehydrogenase (NAD(P)+)